MPKYPEEQGSCQRYISEVVNNQKLDLLNEIFADSFIVHGLVDDKIYYQTIASQREFLSYLYKAFPDIKYSFGDIIGEGDKVAMRVIFSGTHKNEFFGVEASGNRIDYLSEIFFFRFEEGKIKEGWVQLDLYTLFNKLKAKK